MGKVGPENFSIFLFLFPSSPQGFLEVELRWGGYRSWGGRHTGKEVGERPWAWSSALRFTACKHVHVILWRWVSGSRAILQSQRFDFRVVEEISKEHRVLKG